MIKKYETEIFGMPVIMRHDYENEIVLKNIQTYQQKSYEFFKHFLTNVPKFEYDSFLDVGCGDDFVLNMAKSEFKDVIGIDLYIDKSTPNILKSDWDIMASTVFLNKRFNAIFVNHSLEHAKSVYGLMQQISYLQYKNDAIFIAVPDGNSSFSWGITSSTTHFSCITSGYLLSTLQKFGYNVEIVHKQFRENAPEIWAVGIKQFDSWKI